MARSHAKILVSTWRNDEWRDLSMAAQWLYWVLLSQPKLTLVGSLEVTPGRWAQYARGLSRNDIDLAFEELVDADVVLHDPETDELLIRTFTTHDIDPNRVNVNLARGLWGQWACIESAILRREAVLWMPEEVWAKLEPHAEDDARDIRRSGRLEPVDDARLEPGAPPRLEPPPSSHLPTDASRPPAGAAREPRPVDKSHPLAARAATATERLRCGFAHLEAVNGNPNPAAGSESVVVHAFGPRTSGEAS